MIACMHAAANPNTHKRICRHTKTANTHTTSILCYLNPPLKKSKKDGYIQPVAFAVSFNVNLKSQSIWSLFNGTMRRRRRELDNRLSFEIGEMTHPNLIGCI